MKIAIMTFNSKYIHPSLALRILKEDAKYNNISLEMFEYTIKEELNDVIAELIEYDIVAISCYIYNIEKVKKLIGHLKEINSDIIIVLGGPEVSYLSEDEAFSYDVDYIVCGEGEKIFVDLINTLIKQEEISCDYIIDVKKRKMNKAVNVVPLEYAQKLTNSFNNLDTQNQIVYLETSRGCPYLCSYCQASLDNNVRSFNLNYVLNLIEQVNAKRVKIVKFLDRTFNYDVERTNKILSYIIENDNNYTTYQFEITGELLDDSSIELINKYARAGLFRFEIGIQSTNPKANRSIRRYQNFAKLSDNILKIKSGKKVVMHLDLIAGLPHENLNSFIKTFNDVYNFKPLELQLGFLKLLKGTHLNTMVSDFNYSFDSSAPFQIIESDFLSKSDIKIIENTELGLEHLYNHRKAKEISLFLIEKYDLNPFNYYGEVGQKIKFNMQLHELYYVIDDLYIKDIEDRIKLLENYYANAKQRPKVLFRTIDKKRVLHYLIKENNLVQNKVFSNSSVELIAKNMFYVYLFDTREQYIVKMES